MPLPSSDTERKTFPPSFLASSVMTPFSGFPAAARSSFSSIPWSTEFRIICISGSEICSIIFLSTSVVSPIIFNSMFLPTLRDASNTILFIFWNVLVSGIIRMDIMTSCNSEVNFVSCAAALLKLFRLNPGTFKSGFCKTTDSAMTISPIKSMSISIFATFTLINVCAAGFSFRVFASCFGFPGSLVLIT